MKKYLFILLFITTVQTANLLAQMELTIVGGVNLATVKYNDNAVDNNIDISTKSGFILGIETVGGPFIIGGNFIQRGTNYTVNDEDYGEITQKDNFNYLSGYLLYPISIQKKLSIFGGCQLGKGIGGTQVADGDDISGSNVLKADDFNLDFGLLFGADYMINSSIGLRALYFIGLSDVAEGIPANSNFKNRGIGLCLLYKL